MLINLFRREKKTIETMLLATWDDRRKKSWDAWDKNNNVRHNNECEQHATSSH